MPPDRGRARPPWCGHCDGHMGSEIGRVITFVEEPLSAPSYVGDAKKPEPPRRCRNSVRDPILVNW